MYVVYYVYMSIVISVIINNQVLYSVDYIYEFDVYFVIYAPSAVVQAQQPSTCSL